jgi:hypothetical protein
MTINVTSKAAMIAAGAALSIVALASSAQAAILTQWNFNTPAPGDSNPATGTNLPSIGNGTVLRVGGTTGTFVTADEANSASTDPAPTLDDSSLETTTYPEPTALNKSAGVQFNVSTVGKKNVSVSFDQYFSADSSKYSQFQYSTNGTTFLDFGTQVVGAVNTWSNGNLFDLSSIADANNNSNFAFRIVSAFAPNAAGYSGTSGTYATNALWRFDMATVNADAASAGAIPTPALLPGLVGLGLGLLRQRKQQLAG